MSAGNSINQKPTVVWCTRRTSVTTSANGSSNNQKRMRGIILALTLVGAWSVTTSSQSVLPVPKAAFYDNNGNPCASCRLYAYVAGTTTPQNTYSDFALTTPNANPVILDSAGRATVFLNDALNYKFTLSTAADVPIWTVDNITGQLSSVTSITAADTRGLRITRNNAEAGLSISSVGGSGKTYGIASTTGGSLVIQDDADGTPKIQFDANTITVTAASGITTPSLTAASVTSTGSFFANATSSLAGTVTMAGAQVLTSVDTPATLAADANNYNLLTSRVIRIDASGGDGAHNITGIVAGASGLTQTLVNIGASGTFTLVTESASSSAANRFGFASVTVSAASVGAVNSVTIWYDITSSRWRRLD